METQTKRETVHFSLGENAGVLLMSIAQEHLIYSHNPKKALEAITQSLIGIETSMALKILKGDIVLRVETEEDGHQVFMAGDYDESIHSKIFPRLNCLGYCRRTTKRILETGTDLTKAVNDLVRSIAYGGIQINFEFEQILDFLEGETAEVYQEILDDEDVSQLAMLISGVKSFTEQSLKELAVNHFMRRTWPEEFPNNLQTFESDARTALRELTKAFSKLLTKDFGALLQEDQLLNNYLTASREIDRALKEGIEPVNIMANYSAGWLSPEGEYYALNGGIANMLHNQIADALVEKGIIPDLKGTRFEDNPDNWLGSQGWVKVHGNEVDFEGHMNERINRGENKFMTVEQIDLVTAYCRLHHGGIIKIFHQPLSALSFQAMIKNSRFSFYQKYLNW